MLACLFVALRLTTIHTQSSQDFTTLSQAPLRANKAPSFLLLAPTPRTGVLWKTYVCNSSLPTFWSLLLSDFVASNYSPVHWGDSSVSKFLLLFHPQNPALVSTRPMRNPVSEDTVWKLPEDRCPRLRFGLHINMLSDTGHRTAAYTRTQTALKCVFLSIGKLWFEKRRVGQTSFTHE